VHWAGRAGEVVDPVDLEQDGLDDVVADHLDIGVPEVVRDVLLAPHEVVHHDHAVPALHQPVHQVPTNPAPPVTSTRSARRFRPRGTLPPTESGSGRWPREATKRWLNLACAAG
jgi:hypothetical protein